MSNPFVHLELSTSDTAKAKQFYSGLFGWEFTDNDMGGGMIYSTFKPSSGPGGGLFSMPDMPTFWLAYVGVEDINVATDKAKSLGATIHKGPDGDPHHRLDDDPRRPNRRHHRSLPAQAAGVVKRVGPTSQFFFEVWAPLLLLARHKVFHHCLAH